MFLADPCGGYKPRVDVHIRRAAQSPGEQGFSPTRQGWFKVEKKSDWSYASKLLGVHADWPQHEAAELPYRVR